MINFIIFLIFIISFLFFTWGVYFICFFYYWVSDLIKKIPTLYKIAFVSAAIASIVYYISMR